MHLLEIFLHEYLYTVMAYGFINKIFMFKMFQIMMWTRCSNGNYSTEVADHQDVSDACVNTCQDVAA